MKATDVPVLEGFGCRLRPVSVDDAAFIVNLRNQPFAKGKIHDTSMSIEAQRAWIKSWESREDDYYWIIESTQSDATPIGTIGFYDIDWKTREGMPGRWVMLPQTEVNIMAPFLLIYEFVFERLGLDRVVMDVVETNKKVRRFHAAYGAEPIDRPLRYAGEEQSGLELVWLGFAKAKWPTMKEFWTPILDAYNS